MSSLNWEVPVEFGHAFSGVMLVDTRDDLRNPLGLDESPKESFPLKIGANEPERPASPVERQAAGSGPPHPRTSWRLRVTECSGAGKETGDRPGYGGAHCSRPGLCKLQGISAPCARPHQRLRHFAGFD